MVSPNALCKKLFSPEAQITAVFRDPLYQTPILHRYALTLRYIYSEYHMSFCRADSSNLREFHPEFVMSVVIQAALSLTYKRKAKQLKYSGNKLWTYWSLIMFLFLSLKWKALRVEKKLYNYQERYLMLQLLRTTGSSVIRLTWKSLASGKQEFSPSYVPSCTHEFCTNSDISDMAFLVFGCDVFFLGYDVYLLILPYLSTDLKIPLI